MDAASNTGVDDVRDIIDGAAYRPVSARFKIYIIDEVHMLSKVFNASKTLKSHQKHQIYSATTEIRKVPVIYGASALICAVFLWNYLPPIYNPLPKVNRLTPMMMHHMIAEKPKAPCVMHYRSGSGRPL